MNKLFLVVIAVFVTMSGNVYASDEGDLSVGVSMGENALLGSPADVYGRSALGFGGFVLFSPSDFFDLDININYASHKGLGNSLGHFYGTMALRFGMEFDQLFPFICAGVGFYRAAADLGGVEGTAAGFGFNVGTGLDVELGSSLMIGVLMRYHPVFDKGSAAVSPVLGDIFDVMMRVGFMFKTGIQGGWD
ncbi:MAG: hypothetical protein JXA66_06095 [Oligoflexia bacterium]|nr:hypothetical protein [Oligoflexia bacterium]